MVPPAPPTFSTITGWPSDVFIRSLTMRATMSVMPPGGNGTIRVTGFDGKLSALAPATQASATSSTAKRDANFITLSLRLDAVALDDRPPLVELGLVEVVQRLRR